MTHHIDRIIANCRKDSRTVSGSERRALCDEIERLRKVVRRIEEMNARFGQFSEVQSLPDDGSPLVALFSLAKLVREAAEAARE